MVLESKVLGFGVAIQTTQISDNTQGATLRRQGLREDQGLRREGPESEGRVGVVLDGVPRHAAGQVDRACSLPPCRRP